MSFSNSSLVSYTKISPNRNSPRNHVIDTVTVHCYVGQARVEDMCAWLSNPAAKASANYVIGTDGRIGLNVPESDRSWCSSSKSNDNRAVTIECASDKTHPYAINSKVYTSLIALLADICKRNNIKELKWKADKSLIGQISLQNITCHRWFANKACPGDYIYNRLGQIAKEVNTKLGIKKVEAPAATKNSNTQASEFNGLSEAQRAEKMLELVRKTDDSGILWSVSTAQMILESGYVSTDLAQKANNCFGMKCSLSGNTWKTVWDGTSKYTKKTAEQDKNGREYYVTADFRRYPCIENSIKDHSLYLLGALDGNKLRYSGLTACKGYREAITLIKNGHYATDVNYVSKICNIIERYNLARYDEECLTLKGKKSENSSSDHHDSINTNVSSIAVTYIVQAGSFSIKKNAETQLKKVRKVVPDAFISYTEVDGQYRVQAGAFSSKKNAQKRVKLLKKSDIDAIIK